MNKTKKNLTSGAVWNIKSKAHALSLTHTPLAEQAFVDGIIKLHQACHGN